MRSNQCHDQPRHSALNCFSMTVRSLISATLFRLKSEAATSVHKLELAVMQQ